MDRSVVRNRWNVVKTKLMKLYGQLTDEDLSFREGREGEIIGRLQQKLGKSRADVMKLIRDVN